VHSISQHLVFCQHLVVTDACSLSFIHITPPQACHKVPVGLKSSGLSCEDAQDKDDWRLRIKQATRQPRSCYDCGLLFTNIRSRQAHHMTTSQHWLTKLCTLSNIKDKYLFTTKLAESFEQSLKQQRRKSLWKISDPFGRLECNSARTYHSKNATISEWLS